MTRVNKGTRWEYRVRDMFVKMGYFVIRSAGSHGVADLIAIKKGENMDDFGEIKLIQCKNVSNLSKKERSVILRDLQKYNGIYNLSGELWRKYEKSS